MAKRTVFLPILILIWVLLVCREVMAQKPLNIIRPGQEGKFRIEALKTLKTPAKVIGTLADCELMDIDSPVEVSGMGKMMAMDSKGFIWYVESREDKEIRVNPKTLEMTVYQLPAGAAPYSIAIDANDVHWLTAHGIEMLIESHPEEGYCIARQPPSHGFLIHINIHRPTNTVWFNQPGNNQVVSFHVEKGFREYPLPTPQAGPARLDFDKFGNLWVPELYTSKIAKLNMATGEWQEWVLPSPNAMPAFCRVDEDGGVWISEPSADMIAYFNNGKFKEYPVPTAGSVVSSNIKDSEGRLWFTEGGWRGSAGGNKVAMMDPKTENTTEFLLPTKGSQPNGLLIDREGTIWFMQTAVGKIGRVAKPSLTLRQ